MLFKIARELVCMLRENGLTLSLAESCTGGMASQFITAVDGCSAAFLGGVVSYSNEMKHVVLSVKNDILEEHGAVSAQVAEAMAVGVRLLSNSTISGAVTGIAGPGGGTQEKPVGTVYIAVSTATTTLHRLLCLEGDREIIRQQTVAQLFLLLKEMIDKLGVYEV